jgi:hypothetical protein
VECRLCQSLNITVFDSHLVCEACGLIAKKDHLFPTKDNELSRYELHQNEESQGYRDFLSKIIPPLKNQLNLNHKAFLDYGCGPNPLLSKLLESEITITNDRSFDYYDPHFFPNLILKENYDVITCTEVVEHFHFPILEFEKMINFISKGGLLVVMTQFFNNNIDFDKWWYKNDATHVVFYQSKCFDFIREKYNLEIIYNDLSSIVIFKKI